MNERFESIAEEAMVHVPGTKGLHTRAFSLEKFAELLVKDCARLVEESKWNLPRGCTAADQAKYVKEHFGIE